MNAYDIERSIAEGQQGYEDLIQFVLENAENCEAHEIEKNISRLIKPIAIATLKLYLAKRGTGDQGSEIEREDGILLKRESQLRPKNYISIFGPLPIPRTCYRHIGEGSLFPLDDEINLPERAYSYVVQEKMNPLSIDHPFQEGAKRFSDMFDLPMVEKSMVNVSRESSTDYDEYYEQKSPPDPIEKGDYHVISFDGKGVPMINAEAAKIKAKLDKGEKRLKKKEALVGVSYTVDKKERTPKELAEKLVDPEAHRNQHEEKGKDDEPKGKNIRRLASVKRPKRDVMKEIIKDVEKRDPSNSRPVVVLMDGALGLWNLILILLADWKNPVTYILDIIHVRDYLWDVANALFGEKTPEGKIWVQQKLEQILNGGVGYVIGGLKQTLTKRELKGSKRKVVQKAITYFTSHKQWMKYDEYLTAGMPVASGVVESACSSVVKKRMEGEGKRWSIDGAESILLLRSLCKSDDYKAYWQFHIVQENKRLYEDCHNCTLNQDLAEAA